jgi:hypothetical protein
MRENRQSRQAHHALTLADQPGTPLIVASMHSICMYKYVHVECVTGDISLMNIPKGQRRSKRSIFKEYCPVALVIDGALRRSSYASPFTVLEYRV